MYVSNQTLAALIKANPLWKDLAEPFSVEEGVVFHHGGGAPLMTVFLTDGIASTIYGDAIVSLSMRGDAIGHQGLLHDAPFPFVLKAETRNKGFRVLTQSGRRLVEQCPASRAILDQHAHMASVQVLLDRAVAADHPLPKKDAERLNLGVKDLRHVPHLAYRFLTILDADGKRDIAFPHTKISYLLDVRRPTISGMTKAFSAAGAIEQVADGLIRIKNVKLLESFAGQAIVDRRRNRSMFETVLQIIQETKAA